MAQLIDGNAMAAVIRQEIATQITQRLEGGFAAPGLNLLLVGDDPASEVYVRFKAKDCAAVGISSTITRLPATASLADVTAIVEAWNADPAVHGILVQMPLPSHIDEIAVIRTIDPRKDVDGFHPANVGNLMIGVEGFIPCTPLGVLEMLKRSNIDPSGAHAVVVGRSNIVGKPLAMLLAQKRPQGNATVTICHTGTRNLAEITSSADILIAAVGRAGIITEQHVRRDSVVIDVGINRVLQEDGTSRLVGDVDFAAVEPLVRAITPVPGGVGPMTRAMLLRNTVWSAERLQA
jgi:methylenetetrahydrofolate dehydrogenase (NADP+)/methenyltetrahydrofolate cyclohydrolase